MNRKVLFLAVTTAALVGCTTIGAEETVGQRFRKVMAEIDTQCKKDKLGPYLDPSDPEYRTKRNQTDCDILKLKPVDPLATPEGRFAHSLKLPPPHDKPKDVYKSGMTGEEYFKALCAAEAGEWVFRRVEGVEGIFQARSYQSSPSGYSPIVFWATEKGEMNFQNPQDSLVQPYQGRYEYLEIPDNERNQEKNYIRYFRNPKNKQEKTFQTVKDGHFVRIPYIVDRNRSETLNSRYGYTWRGVIKSNAREHGIEGSELIIFERASKDVLAFRRFFVRHTPDPNPHSRYTRGTSCPRMIIDSVPTTFVDPAYLFIQKVLIPVNRE